MGVVVTVDMIIVATVINFGVINMGTELIRVIVIIREIIRVVIIIVLIIVRRDIVGIIIM